MAAVNISTQFDVPRQRMRLVFDRDVGYIEMSLDEAIAVLTEVVSRCQALKVRIVPPGTNKLT